jgi:ribonucleoside-diphosphate reductase beta chain
MLFDKRVNLKPYEYPELVQFKDAIQHSYWVVSEFNTTQDIQDYHVNVTPAERNAIKNTMLAISQIEVSVKAFWGRVYDRIPKPEIAMVGYTFAESEVRHAESYSTLLEKLGLNTAFDNIDNIPTLADRVSYLERYLEGAKSRDNKSYTMSLLLFSVFTENVSLFSQFLIMSAFNKHTNRFKGINNIVLATSKEENIHGLFGMQLINILYLV